MRSVGRVARVGWTKYAHEILVGETELEVTTWETDTQIGI
jgi:hypothetical protein